ncbi:MAG: site-specific DNA-methyltransferase [Methanomassiliicoccales archaeon]|nr:site-specific DNA-methyltransferase [Methanomassiliicoccales archaeon]
MVEPTVHRIIVGDSRDLSALPSGSVDLIVTSPPYPMIGMWDDLFSKLDPEIGTCLTDKDGNGAFERMHRQLDQVWRNLPRLVRTGGVVCINIGDATRKIGSDFQLYSNHARIISKMRDLGFSELPGIIWSKQTNAPNKFMGSGMLPNGAYVTLEHEYVLIFRKGGKRVFSAEENERRYESAYFWEERNEWFSDIWAFNGTRQVIKDARSRKRSAAYPLELAYRLVNMFSIRDDLVLDPFLGTGTTTMACMAAGRNSVGYELDGTLRPAILESLLSSKDLANELVKGRLQRHREFVGQRKGGMTHENESYLVPVVTKQETRIKFRAIDKIELDGDGVHVDYSNLPSARAKKGKRS